MHHNIQMNGVFELSQKSVSPFKMHGKWVGTVISLPLLFYLVDSNAVQNK